jgi:outer membrane protein TolC
MPLATFGKQKASEKIARLEAKVEEARYNETVSNHVFSVLMLHAQLEGLTRQRDLFNNLALDQEELLKSVRRRADQGLSPLSDVDNALSKLNRNISERNVREFRIQEVIAEIKLLSCSQRAFRLNISDIVKSLATRSASLETLNPAILLAKEELNLGRAKFEYQTLEARPTLNLEAQSPISADANEQARIGLSISYEYGNAGKAQRVAASQRQQELAGATFNLDALISKIVTEQTTLQQSIIEYRDKIIPTERDTVIILKRSLDSKKRLFESGRISLFELLSAYDEVASAEIAVEQYNQSMTEAQLKMAKNVGAFSPNSE